MVGFSTFIVGFSTLGWWEFHPKKIKKKEYVVFRLRAVIPTTVLWLRGSAGIAGYCPNNIAEISPRVSSHGMVPTCRIGRYNQASGPSLPNQFF